MKRTGVPSLVAVLGWAAAAPAHAHLVQTGFGDFYDGIAHAIATPADLLVVVALALLAGQRGTQAARWSLLALPLAWLAGGFVGAHLPAGAEPTFLTSLTFGLAGILVALNARLRPGAVAVFVVGAGLIHGGANGAALPSGAAGALALAGAVAVVSCLFAIVAAQVATIRVGWARIALRAAGSWLAAAGILMLGWIVRANGA